MQDLGVLEKFYTSSYINNSWIQNWLTKTGSTYWSRRFIPGLHGDVISSNWRFEFREQLFFHLLGKSGQVNLAVMQRDRNFDQYISRKLRKLDANIFWGFQGSCCNSLSMAKDKGMISILELATAHYPASEMLLQEEKKLHPEWADSIVYADFPQWYYNRLANEPEKADYVVAASKFTMKTLQDAGISENKLLYLPLGFNGDHIPFKKDDFQPLSNRPLRLLYAGRITQMKGIKYLLEAMKSFNSKDVELDLIGFKQGSEEALEKYSSYFKHHPHVSQLELFSKYKEYDALVLPSIFEGFGLVIIEAMAAGIPVITTPHTIGPNIIEDGQNGYLVPIRDVEAIVNAIDKLLNKTSDEFLQMRINARNSAMYFTWENYGIRLKELLSKLV